MTSPARREPPATTVITGAAGWLGTALLHALTGRSVDGRWDRTGTIRALVENRLDAERLAALDPRVRPVIGDVTDRNSLDTLLSGADGPIDVLHTAGVIHPDRVSDFDAVNVVGTRNMLDAAATVGVRRCVHISSNSPFGTNAHPADRFRNHEPYHPYLGYGRSKMEAELAVLRAAEQGLNVVIVRPPWFYGPHQPARQTTFFKMVRTGKFPVIGTGEQNRSMVYVENLVQGIVLAELTPTERGRAWWIADAEPYTVSRIVAAVGDALAAAGLDVTPNRVRLPQLVSDVAERADRFLQDRGRYHQQLHVLGEMGKTIACDISAARVDLDYEPTISIDEGMRRSVQWCLDQGMVL